MVVAAAVLGVLAGTLAPTAVLAAAGEIQSVSAGAYHSCLVRTDQSAWCWGRDSDGQVGFLGIAESRDPKRVKSGSGYLAGVKVVSAGLRHSCALRTDGTVWCWGAAEYGQVGDGTTGDGNGDRLVPAQVRTAAGYLTDITAISAGGYHTCARRSDGTAWCWGSADKGQVGDGTTGDASHVRLKAVQVRRGSGHLTGVTGISTGENHSCAWRGDGRAFCWGDATYGQIGDGTTGDPVTHLRLKAVNVLTESGPLTDVKAVSVGAIHTCAVKTDTTAWCWGSNAYRQLGIFTADGTAHPYAVPFGQGLIIIP